MVLTFISLDNYLVLSETYPNLPLEEDLYRDYLEQYLISWDCAKKKYILTCGDDLAYDGAPERWLFFL